MNIKVLEEIKQKIDIKESKNENFGIESAII